MKKLYAFAFILSAGIAAAQLTQANHAPAAGDTWSMYHCDSVNVNPGASGTNAVWNFSTITTYSTKLQNFAATSLTSNTLYPAANVSVSAGAGSSAVYKSSASALEYYGGNVSIGMVQASLVYTTPAVYAGYPLTVGNSTALTMVGGNISASISPFSGSGTFTGTSVYSADGSGTLTMPGTAGIFTNVIRVVTSQNLNFSVTAFGTPVTGTVVEITYEYYQVGTKAPIFSIFTASANTSAASGTQTQTTVMRNKDAVGMAPPTVTNSVAQFVQEAVGSVYPNPATSMASFGLTGGAQGEVTLYDVTGKAVIRQPIVNGEALVDLSSTPGGLYLYRISSEGREVKAGKLAVSH